MTSIGGVKICFLNPFSGDAYDRVISDSLAPYARPDTSLEIRHLGGGFPPLDYYVTKHLVEEAIIREAIAAERDGFDAMIIGCCYDPALTQAREATTIPIVGPLESAVGLARPFGHRYAIVTDHHKAVPMIADLVRQYGAEPNCTAVTAIEWHISKMIEDPASVAADARARCKQAMETGGAEAVVLGCTIIGACHELDALERGSEIDDSGIINPTVIALKVAELFADLHLLGQYRISRRGYYEPFARFDAEGAAQVLATLMDRNLPRP